MQGAIVKCVPVKHVLVEQIPKMKNAVAVVHAAAKASACANINAAPPGAVFFNTILHSRFPE